MLIFTQILKYIHSIGCLQEFEIDLEDYRAEIIHFEDLLMHIDDYGIELTPNQETYLFKYLNEKTFNLPFLKNLLKIS